MIRTLIEISAEKSWDHETELRAALDKLGYEPKRNAAQATFFNDLINELHDRGLDPMKMVEDRRAKRNTERAS